MWVSGSQGLRRGQDLTCKGGSFFRGGDCILSPVFLVGYVTLQLMERNTEESGDDAAWIYKMINEMSLPAKKYPPNTEIAPESEQWRPRAGGGASCWKGYLGALM